MPHFVLNIASALFVLLSHAHALPPVGQIDRSFPRTKLLHGSDAVFTMSVDVDGSPRTLNIMAGESVEAAVDKFCAALPGVPAEDAARLRKDVKESVDAYASAMYLKPTMSASDSWVRPYGRITPY